jgi:MutS-like protein
MSSMNDTFKQFEKLKAGFQVEAKKRKDIAGHISNARLVSFLAAATGFVGGLLDLFPNSLLAFLIGIICLAVFIVLVFIHDRVIRSGQRFELLVEINKNAISRMKRKWGEIPHLDIPASVTDDPSAVDLDIFSNRAGEASLFGLMGRRLTSTGQETLTHWVLNPANPKQIIERQQAVAELSEQLSLRQDFELQTRLMPSPSPNVEPFLDWAASHVWMSKSVLRTWVPRLLTLNVWIFIVLHMTGILPPLWLFMAILNLLYTGTAGRKVNEILSSVSSREQAFDSYARLFEMACLSKWKSSKLKDLQSELTADELLAHKQMKRLHRLGTIADVRFSPMLFVPLQSVTMWSFHVLARLELWQTQVGPRCRNWFDVLGQIESLCAVAALRYENPDWNFPAVEESEETLEAKELGHPLLQRQDCVTNDVTIGPRGKFQMITGSNMSGKSTLLRSIGLNIVLAQLGSVVFAKKMSLPPMVLGTSFRVQDSIQAGVSFFMAELKRLKQIVDLSKKYDGEGGPRFFYLLDEILQGTNVIERQIAVQTVVTRLLKNGALGAISTHDLALAEAKELKAQCDARHFTEQYEEGPGGPSMQFDYTLKKGVAPTVNALKLLKIVGLGQED